MLQVIFCWLGKHDWLKALAMKQKGIGITTAEKSEEVEVFSYVCSRGDASREKLYDFILS